MKIAYIIFNGITWLDFIGVYDVVSRLKSMNYLPDLSWDVVTFTSNASDNFGLKIEPNKIGISLEAYDAIIIPGGFGTRTLQYDYDFIAWIQTAKNVKYKISVCTGSLILGAAGFLKEKKATSNHQEYEALKPYCKQVVESRIVDDQNIITASIVTASIDLGLYLCQKWVNKEASEKIKSQIGYSN